MGSVHFCYSKAMSNLSRKLSSIFAKKTYNNKYVCADVMYSSFGFIQVLAGSKSEAYYDLQVQR